MTRTLRFWQKLGHIFNWPSTASWFHMFIFISDFYGVCLIASCSIAMRVSWKPKHWFTSAKAISRKCTVSLRATNFPNPITPNCNTSGWKLTTLKRKSFGDGRWGPSANTVLGANFPCPEPFGMEKRPRTASRRNPDKCYENGTTTIRIPVLGKNGNCQKPLGSLPRKSPIGSKIDDKETERRKERGKCFLISFY